MSEQDFSDFSIDNPTVPQKQAQREFRSRPKPQDPAIQGQLDEVGDRTGFPSRSGASSQETPKRRGRKPSPRTGQVHAKTYPEFSDWIAEQAQERGCTQGVIIEELVEAWLELHGEEGTWRPERK